MKLKTKNFMNKCENNVTINIGTDIPPLSLRQGFIFGHLEELIKDKEYIDITLDDLFKEFTYSKKNRFLMLSKLQKIKAIEKTRITDKLFRFRLIPKINFRQSKEIRMYHSLNRNTKRELLSDLK